MNDNNILIGKIINKIRIASDKKAILFITNEGEIIARADGDCCSSTWIEHVELPAFDFPLLVKNAENIDMPQEDKSDDDGDVLSFYGFKIITDKGAIIIDYRNASNGYYGGDLCWPGDYFYGGVYGQNVSNEEWVDLKEDL